MGHYDLNIRACIGTIISGNGFSDTETIFGIMGIPFLTKTTFGVIQNKLEQNIKNIANHSFQTWAKGQTKFIEFDKYSSLGVPSIRAQMDAGWSKRNKKNGAYSAKSAALPLIEHTKKIVSLQIANKFCSFCESKLTQNKPHENCHKNFNGSSTAMEPELALRAVKYVEEIHNLHLTEFIGDGDSSSFKHVRENVDWFMKKLNCINHLLRNSKRKLIELSCSNNKTKKILNKFAIDKLIGYVRNIIRNFGQEDNTRSEQKLIQHIKQLPYHLHGFHAKCTSELCNKQKTIKMEI